VICSKCEVFLVCTELAAGKHLASFAVNRHFESVLDWQGLNRQDFDIPVAESD
jgi:hypothetical protein